MRSGGIAVGKNNSHTPLCTQSHHTHQHPPMPEAVTNKYFMLMNRSVCTIKAVKRTWERTDSSLSYVSVVMGRPDPGTQTATGTPPRWPQALPQASFSARGKKDRASSQVQPDSRTSLWLDRLGPFLPSQSQVKEPRGCDRSNPVMWPSQARKCLAGITRLASKGGGRVGTMWETNVLTPRRRWRDSGWLNNHLMPPLCQWQWAHSKEMKKEHTGIFSLCCAEH